MKTNTLLLLLLGGLAAPVIGAAAPSDADMVKSFKSNKCNECHSLSKFNVSADPEGDKKKDDKDDDRKPIDLSTDKRAPEHDVAWTTKYLQKKEKIKGKKHKKRFPGDDKELEALVAWLDSIKAK